MGVYSSAVAPAGGSPLHAQTESLMDDLLYLAVALVLFAVAGALVRQRSDAPPGGRS